MHRLDRQPVYNDGSVLRETLLSQLESQDFSYRRFHLEFAIELSGSLASVVTGYLPNLMTSKECFYQHVRGIIKSLKFFNDFISC